MSDLAEFLLARIAEDEAVARDAATYTSFEPGWVVDSGTEECGYTVRQERLRWELTEGANLSISYAKHIARWDPARVLAECEAKRQIILLRAMAADQRDLITDEGQGKLERLFADETLDTYTDIMRLLALPYADHPDYREEWRP